MALYGTPVWFKLISRGGDKMSEQELAERVTSVEQSVKSAHHRIDELAESSRSLTEIVVEMKYMRRDLNELIERMSNVEARPGRKYDHFINALIGTAAAALISFILK